jgi:hypothetical protein
VSTNPAAAARTEFPVIPVEPGNFRFSPQKYSFVSKTFSEISALRANSRSDPNRELNSPNQENQKQTRNKHISLPYRNAGKYRFNRCA